MAQPIRALAALVLAVVLALAAAPSARAGDPPPGATPPASSAAPLRMTIGFCIFDVRDVDLRAQSFFADFYIWTRYTIPAGASLTGDALEKFEFMNGRPDTREEITRSPLRDGGTYVCWRMSGTFHFEAKLESYPFDTQDLEVVIEQPSLEADAVEFVDDVLSYDRSGLPARLFGVKDDLDIPEFTLRTTERRVVTSTYRTDFGDLDRPQQTTSYSRLVIAMRFGRDFWPYLVKFMIPLLVIIAMAYLVFYLPAKEIQTASGLGISALLSAIAFNISIAANLPEVGYLVVSDKFFIATYLVLLLTLLQSVLVYVWYDDGLIERARRWLGICRVVFPAMYVVIFSYLVVQAIARR
jgi:hypothetical protein